MTMDTTRLRSIANSAIGNGGAIVATPEELLALQDRGQAAEIEYA